MGRGQVVFVDTFVPDDPRTKRRLTIRKDDGVYQGSGAVINHVLDGLPSGTTVAFLAPASVTALRSFEGLRAKINDVHGVEWLIYADGRLLPGVHHAFQFVILVVVVNAGPAQLTRLVDLRGVDPGHWLLENRGAKEAVAGGGRRVHRPARDTPGTFRMDLRTLDEGVFGLEV